MGSYAGFFTRAAGYRRSLLSLFLGLTTMALFIAFVRMRVMGTSPNQVFWFLPVLAVIALACRTLARRAVLHLDWCRIRPARRGPENRARHDF